jgi:hypothetical protein
MSVFIALLWSVFTVSYFEWNISCAQETLEIVLLKYTYVGNLFVTYIFLYSHDSLYQGTR